MVLERGNIMNKFWVCDWGIRYEKFLVRFSFSSIYRVRVVFQASSLVCRKTARRLCEVGIVDHCLNILKCLLEHWKNVAQQEEVS